MSSTPVRGKSVATGKPTSMVAKFLHNGLNIVVGILTFGAFICAVMFFSSGGYSAESISPQTVSAGALQDKINLESQSINAGNTDGSRNASLSGGDNNLGGTGSSGYNTGGNSGNPATAGTSGDVASTAGISGTSNDASTDNNGAGGSGTVSTGGQSTVAGNNGNGSSGGSGSGGNGSTGGSNSLNRIKSACFGGVGHCYNGN